MGRRHLAGLLDAGFDVVAREPSLEAREQASRLAQQRAERLLSFVDVWPAGGSFDAAIFAETAPTRCDDVEAFLQSGARARRLLLEKPITCEPARLEGLAGLLARHGVGEDTVAVNLAHRLSPFYGVLRTLAQDSGRLLVSCVGGAVGIGCNGVHYVDLFDFLAPSGEDVIASASLSPTLLPSSRGPQFRDFGGEFLVRRGSASLFLSLSAESSAAAVSTIRGDHFIATLDEPSASYAIHKRSPASQEPTHRYGRDYALQVQATVDAVRYEELTAAWASGRLELPSLEVGRRVQRLVFRMLAAAGAPEPYCFT
jgi:predicted dehydrogenase